MALIKFKIEIKKNIDKIKSYLLGWIFNNLFNPIKPDTNLIKSILINLFIKKQNIILIKWFIGDPLIN